MPTSAYLYRTEEIQDEVGAYTCKWFCPPPREGVNYSIVRDIWTEDLSERYILEIRIHG